MSAGHGDVDGKKAKRQKEWTIGIVLAVVALVVIAALVALNGRGEEQAQDARELAEIEEHYHEAREDLINSYEESLMELVEATFISSICQNYVDGWDVCYDLDFLRSFFRQFEVSVPATGGSIDKCQNAIVNLELDIDLLNASREAFAVEVDRVRAEITDVQVLDAFDEAVSHVWEGHSLLQRTDREISEGRTELQTPVNNLRDILDEFTGSSFEADWTIDDLRDASHRIAVAVSELEATLGS